VLRKSGTEVFKVQLNVQATTSSIAKNWQCHLPFWRRKGIKLHSLKPCGTKYVERRRS